MEENFANLSTQELKRLITKLLDMFGRKKFEEGLRKATKDSSELELKLSANGSGYNKLLLTNCTLRDKILLYVADNYNNGNNHNALIFSRSAIANALNVAESQISRAARKLLAHGNILKKRIYVPQTGKFRDVYEVTSQGAFLAQEIKEKLEVRK
jgi:DNA-binding MarR family transcriptional regulator